MTVEEFKEIYPDYKLKKLITAALDALNRVKHTQLSYDNHIVQLMKRDKPVVEIIIYYRNEAANKIADYKTGEYLYTTEDMGIHDKVKKITPDMTQDQKIILRIAGLIYTQEKHYTTD